MPWRVSIAVPTIAFGGATEVPQEAWSLVEGLAPAYGSDWWYAGMLAFMRQEQERWDEAAELSERALAEVPSSGHAVHARAHVYYETGDHDRGLAFLDPWIDSCGRAASPPSPLRLARRPARAVDGRRHRRPPPVRRAARPAGGDRDAGAGRLGVAAVAGAAGRRLEPTRCPIDDVLSAVDPRDHGAAADRLRRTARRRRPRGAPGTRPRWAGWPAMPSRPATP